jgi:hypothetical protein
VKLIDSPNNINAYIASHHLKFMMMDEPNGNVCAFAGGLDLAVGRYDTPGISRENLT